MDLLKPVWKFTAWVWSWFSGWSMVKRLREQLNEAKLAAEKANWTIKKTKEAFASRNARKDLEGGYSFGGTPITDYPIWVAFMEELSDLLDVDLRRKGPMDG